MAPFGRLLLSKARMLSSSSSPKTPDSMDDNTTTSNSRSLGNEAPVFASTSGRQGCRFSDVFAVSDGETIGNGSFSEVRQCTHRRSGQEFAVKILRVAPQASASDASQPASTRDEVDAELKVCASLASCPGVVRLHEAFEEIDPATGQGFVYAVFELMRGGDLSRAIIERGSLPEDDARSVLRNLFATCASLKRRRLVHRDIKLDNILLQHSNDFDGGVKLADMGMAESVARSADGQLHRVCGTPLYIAPEMLRFQQALSSPDSLLMSEGYGAEVDVWSCGVCLYQLLCGFPPFEGKDVRELFQAITTGRVGFGDPAWEMVTPEAKDLVRRCLTRDPTGRITPEEALTHPWMQGV